MAEIDLHGGNMAIVNLNQVPQHLATLALWHHNEWSHLNPGNSLQKRQQLMQSELSDSVIPTTFVYLDGEALAGSASLLSNDMDTHPELSPWLASVYVHPKFRHKGVGTALVEQIQQFAFAQGYEQLYLFTEAQKSFYQGMGWKLLSQEDYRGNDVCIMKCINKDKK